MFSVRLVYCILQLFFARCGCEMVEAPAGDHGVQFQAKLLGWRRVRRLKRFLFGVGHGASSVDVAFPLPMLEVRRVRGRNLSDDSQQEAFSPRPLV